MVNVKMRLGRGMNGIGNALMQDLTKRALHVNAKKICAGTIARALFMSTLTVFFLLAGSAYAATIVEIALSPLLGTPFLLDDTGQVWAFRKPRTLEKPFKLPKLNHIKKIAPYIAIDTDGHVYTWSYNDKKSYWEDALDTNSLVAFYTTPHRVENLQGVNMVASYGPYHFAAVIGDKDIVDWEIMPDKMQFDMHLGMPYGPIRSVISRKGVKALTVNWAPEVISIKKDSIAPAASSLVALFDDGTVMGWGIKPTGAATRGADWQETLLTQSPGATGVSMNEKYTVVLAANGTPQYWGGCDAYGKDSSGRPSLPSSVAGAKGFVVDVEVMAVGFGTPDVFIKRDGTVWAAYAPAPNGVSESCYEFQWDKRKALQLSADSAAAIQVVTGGPKILMLDAEHKLWTADDSWMNTKFHNVSINLQ